MKQSLGKTGISIQAWRAPLLLGSVAAFCCALSVALFNPGYMSLDSVHQLMQARSLELSDHHPISMALLWHGLDKVLPGPLGMLILSNLLYWFGLALLVGTRRWPLWLRCVVLPLLGAYPPVYCLVGAVWKDSLMQATLLAALGVLLAYGRTRRAGFLVAWFLLSAFALSVRHNAIGAVWPLAMLPLLASTRLQRLALPARLASAALLAMLGSCLTWVLLLKALSPLAAPAHFWQMIAGFDLAGMSVRTGQVLIDPETTVLREGASLTDIRRAYRPSNHMSYYTCASRKNRPCTPLINRVFEPQLLKALSDNWKREVLRHPKEYLAHRYAVYELVTGLGAKPAKLWYLNPGGLAREYPLNPRGLQALAWFRSLSATAWMTVWHYLVLAALCAFAALGFLLRTGSALPLALALSSLSYSVTLFLGSGAQDYRYSEWSVMTAVLALVTLLEPWRRATPREVATVAAPGLREWRTRLLRALQRAR